MAITVEEVNGENTIHFGADDDDYDDLIQAQTDHADAFNADTDLPQVVRCKHLLYTTEDVGVTLKNAFLIIDPTSAIAVYHINGFVPNMLNEHRRGFRIQEGTIVINSSDDANLPTGANGQRPSIIRRDNNDWESVDKRWISPLQLQNATLIFCTSENGNANGLVISYAVGDGLGATRIIRDKHLTATNDRLFIGGGARFINADLYNWSHITFNDVVQNLGLQNFDNCRIIGADTDVDCQGLTILKGMRFIDNEKTTNQIIGYYGSANTPRRACRCYVNMTPMIDGGVSATNSVFALIAKNGHNNLNGVPQFFLNEYNLSVKDPAGEGIEDVIILGFLKKGTGDLQKETALDFTDRYKAYAYNSSRYGDVTDQEWAAAGGTISTRIADNFSLDGKDELETNSDGDTIVSGETDITRPQLRAVEIKFDGTTSGFERTNFTEHKFRVAKWLKLTQDITVPIGFDTDDDASNRAVNVIMNDDEKITQETKATVAAYTSISDLNEMYDYIRHLEYEARGNPKLKLIEYRGKTVVFPEGSTFETSTTQAVPVAIDYSGSAPVYTFKEDDTINVPLDDNLNSIDLSSTGDAGEVDLGNSVRVTDQNGTTIVFQTSEGNTLIRIEVYNPETNEHESTVTGTSDSSGFYSGLFDSGKTLKIFAKKFGYNFRFQQIDDTTDYTDTVNIPLDIMSHVDTGIDLDNYNDESDTSNEDKVYFNYVASKSQFVIGEINTSSQLRLTEALLDKRMTTQEGLHFFADYNTKVKNLHLTMSMPSSITNAFGLTHDADFMWVIAFNNDVVYKISYTNTLENDPVFTSAFTAAGGVQPSGADIHKNNLWVTAASPTDKVFIYSKTGTRQNALEFNMVSGNTNPTGICGRGNTVVVVDGTHAKVFVYPDNFAADSTQDVPEHDLAADNANPVGITWNPDLELWAVLDSSDRKVYHYDEDWNHMEHYDFDLDSAAHNTVSGLKYYNGVYWVLDSGNRKIFGYATFASQMQFLSGRPYHTDTNQAAINQHALEFVRAAGMVTGEISRLGLPVYERDESMPYSSPLSHGGNVTFDGLAVNVHIATRTLTESAEEIIANEQLLAKIAAKVWNRTASLVSESNSIGKELKDNLSDTKSDAESIKATTDQITFLDGDVVSTLDGEATSATATSVPIHEFEFVIDESDKKVYVYGTEKTRIATLDFPVPHVNDIEGIFYYRGRFYVLHAPSAGTRHIYVYDGIGRRLEDLEFDLHGDNISPQDLVIYDGKMFVLDNTANSQKLFVYDLDTHDRITNNEVSLGGAENLLGFAIYEDKIYAADARTLPASTKVMRIYRLDDGAALTAENFNLASGQSLPTGVTHDGVRIRVCDQQSTSKIFVYSPAGSHLSQEDWNLDAANDHPRGMTIVKASPHVAQQLGDDLEAVRERTDKLKFAADDDVIATLDGESVSGGGDGGGLTDAQAAELTAIKTQTDKMNFNNADDIKATLDGEEVVGNDGLTISQAAELSAIKTKTDKLNFNNDDDVIASLDGEEVTTDTESRAASKADVSALATQANLNAVKTIVEMLEKFQKANITVEDDDLVFEYDGEELVRFTRRTTTTDSDWSGGREIDES